MRAFAILGLLSLAAASHAAPIAPTSYNGPNGGTGLYTYFDDTYGGVGSTGDPTIPYSPLAGGLGQLTDGLITALSWFADPGPWVAWMADPHDNGGAPCILGDPGCNPGLGDEPGITFNFASVSAFGNLMLHVDDSNGYGGVRPPFIVQVIFFTFGVPGSTLLEFVIPDPASGTPLTYNLNITGGVGDMVLVRLIYRDAWIFVDEVGFDSTAAGDALSPTPEPAAFVLAGGGLALIAWRSRSRRTR